VSGKGSMVTITNFERLDIWVGIVAEIVIVQNKKWKYPLMPSQ
jgi:hypothetical protein